LVCGGGGVWVTREQKTMPLIEGTRHGRKKSSRASFLNLGGEKKFDNEEKKESVLKGRIAWRNLNCSFSLGVITKKKSVSVIKVLEP